VLWVFDPAIHCCLRVTAQDSGCARSGPQVRLRSTEASAIREFLSVERRYADGFAKCAVNDRRCTGSEENGQKGQSKPLDGLESTT